MNSTIVAGGKTYSVSEALMDLIIDSGCFKTPDHKLYAFSGADEKMPQGITGIYETTIDGILSKLQQVSEHDPEIPNRLIVIWEGKNYLGPRTPNRFVKLPNNQVLHITWFDNKQQTAVLLDNAIGLFNHIPLVS